MNTFCTFYIVRHAQSEANKTHIISGQIDSDLSEEGVGQAKERAKEFASIKFSAAFSSDLVRANKTASIITQEHKLAVVAHEILRERHYGSIQGSSYDSLEKKMKKLFDTYNAMSYKKRFSVKVVPDMESDEEVIGRFTTFLRETALAYVGKTVLIVCHGNMMRTLLVHLGFGTHQEFSHGTAKNTSYFILNSDGVDFEVVKTVGIEKNSNK